MSIVIDIFARLKGAKEDCDKRGAVNQPPMPAPVETCCKGDPAPVQAEQPKGPTLLQALAKTAVNMAEFAVSARSTPEVIAQRKAICEGCQEKDSDGRVIYRVINGTPWCGRPWPQKIRRDDALDGCGCDLSEKWTGSTQVCPRGLWQNVVG